MGAVTPPFYAKNSIPFVYNFTPKKLSKWAAALDKQRDGSNTTRASIIVPGNSVSRGHNPGAAGTQLHTKAWPKLCSSLLNSYLFPCEGDSVWGSDDRDTNAAFLSADPRVGLGTGVIVTSNFTAGGRMFRIPLSAAGKIDFTPGNTFDRVEWRTYVVSGAGNQADIDVYADNVLITTQAVTGNLHTFTTTVPNGTLKVSFGINASSTVDCYMRGWNTYTAADNKVSMRACGTGGWRVADWISAASAYAPLNAITDLAPNLSVIPLDINDQRDGTDLATFASRKRTMIEACLASGDVILMNDTPVSATDSAIATQLTYKAVNRALSAEYDLPLIDLYSEWGSYTEANALGRMADTIHPNAPGSWALARALFRVLQLV